MAQDTAGRRPVCRQTQPWQTAFGLIERPYPLMAALRIGLSNRKECLLISGMGSERFVPLFG